MAQFFIIVSYAFFIHTHILDDGTQIIHAHFFQKGIADDTESTSRSASEEPPVNHQHTPFSYSFFANVNLLFKNKQAEFNFIPDSFQITRTTQKLVIPFSSENFNSLRAPPFILG